MVHAHAGLGQIVSCIWGAVNLGSLGAAAAVHQAATRPPRRPPPLNIRPADAVRVSRPNVKRGPSGVARESSGTGGGALSYRLLRAYL